MISCNGICERYKFKGRTYKGGWYGKAKRCSVCALFIVCDGFICPCCKSKLATRPRRGKLNPHRENDD